VILFDTHVLVWLSTEPGELSEQARRTIRGASRSGGIAISTLRCGNWPGLPVIVALRSRESSKPTSKKSLREW